MTLYELTADYMRLLDFMEDPEMDEEIIKETMEQLTVDITDKADGYGRVVRQLEADAGVLKAEEKRLSQKRKTIEANIDRVKKSLKEAMIAMGMPKMKTELFAFTVKNNPASVVIDTDSMAGAPAEFIRQADPEWNKAAIAAALKAGKDLGGIAHLEQTQSLIIK